MSVTGAGKQDKALLGIGLMVAAYFVFSLIDLSAKWLAVAGISSLQLAFMRYLPHLAVSIAVVGQRGKYPLLFRRERMGEMLFRGALLMLSTSLNFLSLRYLPLTLTSTILFSAPIITCLLSGPLLGERVGPWRWCAILLGFFGILIAIRPFDADFHIAALLSLGAATSFAFYSIMTRRLAGEMDVDIMQFHTGFVGVVALLPFAVTQWTTPGTMFDMMVMICLGVLGWGGHQLLTSAHRFAESNLLMPFGYSFILFLTLWSFLVFGNLPDQMTITGAVIIVISGLIIWAREWQRSRLASGQGRA